MLNLESFKIAVTVSIWQIMFLLGLCAVLVPLATYIMKKVTGETDKEHHNRDKEV